MMSTKMMSGSWSVILERASNPSSARITWQPACARKISALRRMVLESSITITFTPPRFAVSLKAPSLSPEVAVREKGGERVPPAPSRAVILCDSRGTSYSEFTGSANYLTRFLKCEKRPDAGCEGRCRDGVRHDRRDQISTISKSSLRAPHSGQVQFIGTSSHRVPGAMPSSGNPAASSYTKPQMRHIHVLY